MSQKKIEHQCDDCCGTGVYCGFAEPQGVGVVCLGCRGTGKAVFRYTPFTGRKRKRGVSIVKNSRGVFIGTGVGPVGKEVSYRDFYNKNLRPKG